MIKCVIALATLVWRVEDGEDFHSKLFIEMDLPALPRVGDYVYLPCNDDLIEPDNAEVRAVQFCGAVVMLHVESQHSYMDEEQSAYLIAHGYSWEKPECWKSEMARLVRKPENPFPPEQPKA